MQHQNRSDANRSLKTPGTVASEWLDEGLQGLERQLRRYRDLFKFAPVGYLVTNAQGVIEEANLAVADLLDSDTECLAGSFLSRFVTPEEKPAFSANLSRLARSELNRIDEWQIVLQPKSGPAIPASITVERVQQPPDIQLSLRWIIRDNTALKEAEAKSSQVTADLEQKARERTSALEAANKEMEAFIYSVSHDLRAPLRHVSGFTKALLEDYRAQLDAQGISFLEYAHEASGRLGRLVDDLLDLSRVTRKDLHQQELDLTNLANSVIAELRHHDPKRAVKALIAPNLSAHGDQGLLRIALSNLLSNAWKFTARVDGAKIEFGSLVQNGKATYFVRDNGAGFDPAHSKRLFGVFQRLHSQDEFPGNGVGLAIVKRILTRHGGEVWAESETGKGATFYFTLPT
ncbi:MAG: hypothetical protein C5B50_28375 [Verrucomicrobia bacterium]|nr:MAG: hypothetical protein C5B50_28375 [Verrucomicrobiota bacterium]